MNNIVIIQARTGATRLPNKVLLPLSEKIVLEHVIERVKRCNLVSKIVIATTIQENDLAIVKFCARNGITVFSGSENDVLDRYYQAAKLFQPDNVIRITADCPMIDHKVIDEVIETHIIENADYTSNVLEETYPDGLDCEVMKFSVLKEANEQANLSSQREHVTQFIIHNDKYKKVSVKSKVNHGNERWTLDTKEDYLFIQAIYNELYNTNPDFGYEEIIDLLLRKPELKKLNNNSVRNEGLIKSLKNDHVVDIQ